MRYENSVLQQILKHIPWGAFDRLVEEHQADKHVRRLSTKSQFVALLYGQLSNAASLREIEAGLESCQSRLYHLGVRPIRRSTLSDANLLRPAVVFSELLALMMKLAHRGLRRALADTTYLIDSTGLRLDERSAGWARFSTGVCGAKVHVIYDAGPRSALPEPTTLRWLSKCPSSLAPPMFSTSAITIIAGGQS